MTESLSVGNIGMIDKVIEFHKSSYGPRTVKGKMENIEEKLSNLISDPDFEKLELWLKIPNIFSVLNASRAEIRHSYFLGWILNPNGTHGMGDLFLRKFLQDILADKKVADYSQFDADSFDLRNVEIHREWNNIDILVLFSQIAVVIENKIDSQDHSDQLKRYRQTLKENFPHHYGIFVYLTPYGSEPKDIESAKVYVNYSYEKISSLLNRILDIYRDSLSSRVVQYLQDYLTVLRRELMKDDKLNELAVKVYKAHREALEFIFDNRRDPADELFQYFESKVLDCGWITGSKNKGYIHFLTPKLNGVIPKGYSTYWSLKESFLFEVDYYSSLKYVIFKTVIAPGNSDIRLILRQALESIPGHKNPQGKQWLVHFMKKWPFAVNEIVNEPKEKITDSINKIWPEVEELVRKVEPALLTKKDKLQKFPNLSNE